MVACSDSTFETALGLINTVLARRGQHPSFYPGREPPAPTTVVLVMEEHAYWTRSTKPILITLEHTKLSLNNHLACVTPLAGGRLAGGRHRLQHGFCLFVLVLKGLRHSSAAKGSEFG